MTTQWVYHMMLPDVTVAMFTGDAAFLSCIDDPDETNIVNYKNSYIAERLVNKVANKSQCF